MKCQFVWLFYKTMLKLSLFSNHRSGLRAYRFVLDFLRPRHLFFCPLKHVHLIFASVGYLSHSGALMLYMIVHPCCVPSHLCWWLIWPIQNDAKIRKNDWNHGKWVFISGYSARAIQWIPTQQGLDGFQKSLRLCDLGESSLSIWRVKVPVVLFLISVNHSALPL